MLGTRDGLGKLGLIRVLGVVISPLEELGGEGPKTTPPSQIWREGTDL